MIKYLLDTNTIVDIIRDKESMPSKRLMAVGLYRCAIADMTVFELLYGAFNSEQREANLQMISNLSKAICTLPSSNKSISDTVSVGYNKGWSDGVWQLELSHSR